MGVVYKAEDTKPDRPVALKLPTAHALEDLEYKAPPSHKIELPSLANRC